MDGPEPAREGADPHGSSPAASPPALVATGVRRRFGAREALRGVDVRVGRGEVLAVLGPNGAGKTTLLEAMAGASRPDEGTVAPGPDAVGWVPQRPAVYGRLSVRENLALFARLEGVADADAVVARMLEQTGLADRADERLGRLSGGGRQRVNVAVGLLSGPPVLLLDEPSSSLDPRQRERLWAFLGALTADGTAIVVSTHDVREAARHADRVLVLVDGAVAAEGPPAVLAAGRDLDGAVLDLLAGAGA